jgi:hypothetical protein
MTAGQRLAEGNEQGAERWEGRILSGLQKPEAVTTTGLLLEPVDEALRGHR